MNSKLLEDFKNTIKPYPSKIEIIILLFELNEVLYYRSDEKNIYNVTLFDLNNSFCFLDYCVEENYEDFDFDIDTGYIFMSINEIENLKMCNLNEEILKI